MAGGIMGLQENPATHGLATMGGLFRRFSAIQWLIFSGVGIVLAIALGTACLVQQFRDRTMEAAERELANTAQVLSHHFDQAAHRPAAHPRRRPELHALGGN
jgi:hypothetical protein